MRSADQQTTEEELLRSQEVASIFHNCLNFLQQISILWIYLHFLLLNFFLSLFLFFKILVQVLNFFFKKLVEFVDLFLVEESAGHINDLLLQIFQWVARHEALGDHNCGFIHSDQSHEVKNSF